MINFIFLSHQLQTNNISPRLSGDIMEMGVKCTCRYPAGIIISIMFNYFNHGLINN